jgi:L-threonylcarbamoyladenylate synthase
VKTEVETLLLPSNQEFIQLASELLHEGQLVAFPTETVYGLGADATNAEAVLSIFKAKGRPADNPLIVHIYDIAQMDRLCAVPDEAIPLMEAFWPGPLTMLFNKYPLIPDEVTAGLSTVAVRMPSHPVAAALLRACGLPVAAPSANSSGKPSPTLASHVMEDMHGKIPLILDGGPCEVGVESTVLDLCHGTPTILRPGGITREMLESVLHAPVALAGSILRPLKADEKALSPGMRYKHYAPKATVTLVEGPDEKVISRLRLLWQQETSSGKKACVLCFSEHMELLQDCSPHDIGSRNRMEDIAHRLFQTLRQLDEEGMESVFSEVVPPEGIGLAVMNRLGRAAAFRTIKV